jgi:hypothetical protein
MDDVNFVITSEILPNSPAFRWPFTPGAFAHPVLGN